MIHLKKAIKKDKDILLANADNHSFLVEWFHNFDPDGEYGRQVYEKYLASIGIEFDYLNPKKQ